MNVRTARLATKALGGVCAVLLVFVILQYAGFGRGISWMNDADDAAARASLGGIDKKAVKIPPASAFAAIEAHPLFNDDREPTPVDASAGDSDTPAPSPLNIALTGVILDEANNVRIAMLRDLSRNQPVALKVGMPLEGDQASWTLIDVKPRVVVFRNAANETTEVELETAVAQAPVRGGRVSAPRNNNAGGNRKQSDAVEPGKGDASADLARRIEERRSKMREDAEKLRKAKSAQPNK